MPSFQNPARQCDRFFRNLMSSFTLAPTNARIARALIPHHTSSSPADIGTAHRHLHGRKQRRYDTMSAPWMKHRKHHHHHHPVGGLRSSQGLTSKGDKRMIALLSIEACEKEKEQESRHSYPMRGQRTCALMWIMAGRRKASVFPLPVALIPTMFRPFNAMGHPWL